MSIASSPTGIIEMAISIERKGIAFYDVMSRSTSEPVVHDVFLTLVGMERRHLLIFQDMLNRASGLPSTSAYPEKQAGDLQDLINNSVFTEDLITSDLATSANTNIRAIDLAIAAEKDSIIFYCELKDIVSGGSKETVDRVMNEEKLHLRQLSVAKNRLKTS